MPRRQPEVPPDGAYAVAAHPDPWLTLHHEFANPESWSKLFLGVSPDGRFLFSAPRTHCLVLGPPQSWKTTGTLTSAIINAPGPVVVTSTKGDVYEMTALARARLGRLWQYAPGGLKPDELLPGAIELRWSPIEPSRDWGTAQILGKALGDTLDVSASSGDNAGFFKKTAGQLIACILHAAALGAEPMEFVLEAVGEGDALDKCERILREAGGYSNIAADQLNSFRRLDGRTRGNIFITASVAFDAYRLPGAIESTRDPNFDVDKFVAGEHVSNPGLFTTSDWDALNSEDGTPEILLPHGMFDTIYMTSGSQAQGMVAPLVVGLISRLKEARYQLNRYDQRNGSGRPPLFLALDEIANIAPLGELPSILSEGSSQGVLVMAVMQDLVQAKARWPLYFEGFLTMFRETVVFPGIRNQETLDRVSNLSGEVFEEKEGWSTTHGFRKRDGNSETQNVSYERRRKYTPDEIAAGAEQGQNPDELDVRRILVIRTAGQMGWAFSTPYFYTPPIAEALLACADHFLDRMPKDCWQRSLPLPRMQAEMMFNPSAAVPWYAALRKDWYAEEGL